MFTPSEARRSTFPSVAEGTENSTAASTPRKFWGVMPSPLALLSESSFSFTAKPYSGASCSISRPILPYPTIARFISVKHRRIECDEEFAMERSYGPGQVAPSHHKTQIQKRGTLGNHEYVHAPQSREHARGHARGKAEILSHHADDGLIVFDAHPGERPEHST